MNKIIIKSAINLKLFTIVITYHLSMNHAILSKLVDELKNIFSLLKMNLYLFIKKYNYFMEKIILNKMKYILKHLIIY